MHRQAFYLWTIALLCGGWDLFVASPQSSAQTSVAVLGWPTRPLETQSVPLWLGDDPVLGRLACPPFSRLNLSKRQSEGLIFQDVKLARSAQGEFQWIYELRSGLYWWDGSVVAAEEVADFITRVLPDLVRERGGRLWSLPAFQVSYSARAVTVSFALAPVFGPYIFNGISLWRPSRALPRSAKTSEQGERFAYECAGIFRPELDRNSVLSLQPNQAYKLGKAPLLVAATRPPGLSAGGRVYEFKMAETFSAKPEERAPSEPAACSLPVDLPLLSVIHWNIEQPKLQDANLRRLLTQLTPRGALLRAGAGHAGDLLSSLIPRNHPGYDPKLLVRPFRLREGAKALSDFGYVRPQGDKDRLGRNAEPLTLNLISLRPAGGLVEKVLADSFLAVGIHARYLPASSPMAAADGVVGGVFLPWPGLDFMANFHSKLPGQAPFWKVTSPELDVQLEAYALSLTQLAPRFELLQKIHNYLYDMEPVTVLMQHRACLEVTGRGPGSLPIDVRDPDWFRKLVL